MALFKKKDADGKAAKKEKPAKAKKAKKKKVARKSSDGGMKTFLALHIEKILLGVLALGALAIIYFSYAKPNIEDKLSPDSVTNAVRDARENLKKPMPPEIPEEPRRTQKDDHYVARAKEDTIQVKLDRYPTVQPWDPVTASDKRKRVDPKLLALEEIEVKAGVGPIAQIIAEAGFGPGGYGGGEGYGGGDAVGGPGNPYGGGAGYSGGVGYGADGGQGATGERPIPQRDTEPDRWLLTQTK